MIKPAERPRLILASNSPRRRHLLKQAGLTFTVIPSDVDEQQVAGSDPDVLVRTLAESKAMEIAEKHPHSWVIGADTIVVTNNQILGKPDHLFQYIFLPLKPFQESLFDPLFKAKSFRDPERHGDDRHNGKQRVKCQRRCSQDTFVFVKSPQG